LSVLIHLCQNHTQESPGYLSSFAKMPGPLCRGAVLHRFAAPAPENRSWGILRDLLSSILIGPLAAGFPGLILGPFVGAAAGELLRGRSCREALRSGWGTFIGFLVGSVVKIAVGVVMIGTFIWWMLF
jgi:hypothetical protein